MVKTKMLELSACGLKSTVPMTIACLSCVCVVTVWTPLGIHAKTCVGVTADKASSSASGRMGKGRVVFMKFPDG